MTKKTKSVLKKKVNRRDFLVLSATALAGAGAAMCAWPFVDSMNPASDVLSLSSIEVDLTPIEPGQTLKVLWRGKPVFIKNRTDKEIEEAEKVEWKSLPDPQPDSARVKEGHKKWLIMIGVCTHLGCIPIGNTGDYDGWFCPCHGSHYDTSGRIRKGPAPLNLIIPEYQFLTDTKIKIG